MRRIAMGGGLLVLLAAVPAATAAPARVPLDLPAVALHQEPPVVPAEAIGTGAAPAVAVRVRIDARGKPVAVETLRIDPPGRFDAAFERATREAVLAWRFAPALRNGAPAETTLEWTVQFAAVAPGAILGDAPTAQSLPFPRTMEEATVAARRRLAGLPVAERRSLREEAARLAESHLAEGRRTRAVSEHFEVITDASTTGVVRRVATQLEKAFTAASRLFGDAIPQEAADRIVVYVYGKHAAFGAFATEDPRSFGSGDGGFFDPAGLLAFHLEVRGGDGALDRLLLQEGARAFLLSHVARPGVTLPFWFEEGLAEYIAIAALEQEPAGADAAAAAGATGRRGAGKAYSDPRRADAADVKKAVRAGGAIPLARLLEAKRQDLDPAHESVFPVQSWMWVHFLRHGKPEWTAGAFPQLVLYLAEGYAAPDVFPSVYGAAPAELGPGFREYVKRL